MDTPSKINTSSTKRRTLCCSTSGLQSTSETPRPPLLCTEEKTRERPFAVTSAPEVVAPLRPDEAAQNGGSWGPYRRRIPPGGRHSRGQPRPEERRGDGGDAPKHGSSQSTADLSLQRVRGLRVGLPTPPGRKEIKHICSVRSFVRSFLICDGKSLNGCFGKGARRAIRLFFFFMVIFYEQCVLNLAGPAVVPYPTLRYHRAIFGRIPMYGAAAIWRKLSTPVQLI